MATKDCDELWKEQSHDINTNCAHMCIVSRVFGGWRPDTVFVSKKAHERTDLPIRTIAVDQEQFEDDPESCLPHDGLMFRIKPDPEDAWKLADSDIYDDGISWGLFCTFITPAGVAAILSATEEMTLWRRDHARLVVGVRTDPIRTESADMIMTLVRCRNCKDEIAVRMEMSFGTP